MSYIVYREENGNSESSRWGEIVIRTKYAIRYTIYDNMVKDKKYEEA